MTPAQTLVSVDLDPVRCYHEIHGLKPPEGQAADVVLRRCVPRFVELFAELDVRATFFVVGWDLEQELDRDGAGSLATALRAGHELANHSYSHAYDLVRFAAGDQRADLARCDGLLRRLGATPVGFRAPGYCHSQALLDHLVGLGYRYDASALPSPSYYAAKLGMIAWHRLRGRHSRSMAGHGGVFFGPRAPHPVAGGRLWELPISVVGPLALPMVGTFALAGPGWVRRQLAQALAVSGQAHLELHGIDLADPLTDGLSPELCRLQPELRVPLAVRRERLRRLLLGAPPVTRLCDAVPSTGGAV